MSSKPLKDLIKGDVKLTSGHRLCAGCAESIIARQVLMSTDKPIVASSATGCFEVSTTIFPYSAWNIPWVHTAFGNGAATGAGVEAAYQSLKRKGKITEEMRFVTFGGDGATYDIGFQALSGAVERGHQMMYVCFNNEAYMNTGIQRSSATPMFADTTTTPAGKISDGKPQNRKDITEVIAAHHVPYVAQTTFMGNFSDLHKKAQKAIYTQGACFLTILAPCPRGWRYEAENVMDICKAAADTCFWPMYEVEYGEKWTLNYKPKNKLPIEDFLKLQGRFKHLLKPGKEEQVAMLQAEVDRRWEALLKKCEL